MVVFLVWELWGPHQYPQAQGSLAVSLGGGWAWVEGPVHSSQTITLFFLFVFFFNLFCLFVNLSPNLHKDL